MKKIEHYSAEKNSFLLTYNSKKIYIYKLIKINVRRKKRKIGWLHGSIMYVQISMSAVISVKKNLLEILLVITVRKYIR